MLPSGFDPLAEHPLLIALHGHGSDRWQYVRDARGECRAARETAARFSMILVSPDYRAPTSWMGPAAEADLVQIIQEQRAQYHIGKVIVSGASMGGTGALTFAALHPELVDGVVSMNGTANLLEFENFLPAIQASFGGTKVQIPEEYKRRSSEYWPERLTMPIALTAGVQDTTVPHQSVARLGKTLRALQRPVILFMDADGGHSTSYEDSIAAYEYTVQTVLGASKTSAPALPGEGHVRVPGVTYCHANGLDLTMDVFKPRQPNGIGLLHVVSEGWTSTTNMMSPGFIQAFLARGYTVFAAMHDSQPHAKLAEILFEIQTAVRFVRAHAAEYKIDPERLGIYGSSSSGHLTLMVATCGTDGRPDAPDPLQRVSSRVQAAACFCPATDVSNYGQRGVNAFRTELKVWRSTVGGAAVETDRGLEEFAKELSPISHLSTSTPPVLIIHGDKDPLVPVEQVRVFIEKCRGLGIPARLVVRAGEPHIMSTWIPDHAVLAVWFDQTLLKPRSPTSQQGEGLPR
jgi:dipeptidyl aminopeptidase/acylaminoacyl peptidase